ncbi:MAG: hypothetical protein ACT452_12415 [Microthrixaceae bacterium]
MTRWRAIVAATAVAVITTTGVAAAVSEPAPPGAAPIEVTGAPTTPMASPAEVSAPSLPSVTQHALGAEVVGAAQARPVPAAEAAVTEVIQLEIIGGELVLATPSATVTLERVLGSDVTWTGILPSVRVVDARGTHEGWDVRWTVTGLDVAATSTAVRAPHARVRLDPAAPVVVDGTPDGLLTGRAGPGVRAGRTLFGAAPGSGGGTYEAGGAISVRLPSSIDADRVVVQLAFAVV